MKQEGIIIGGGASGLMAAITAAENGASVTILEHMPRVGKKILSTGNGKCNMTNLVLTEECYRSDERDFPMRAVQAFGPSDTITFFRRLGVLTTEKNGYVYPASGQAQTILDALRGKAESLGVTMVCGCHITSINIKENPGHRRFEVSSDCGRFAGDFLILAAGSMAAPVTGSDGSGYGLAKDLGHKIKKPLPALVQLKCKGDWFRALAGVRTDAKVSLYTMTKDGGRGELLASDTGELQLTDYGISGIPVFQISRYAAEALDRKKRVLAAVDFMPAYSEDEVCSILNEQRAYLQDREAAEFLNGLFHKKLAALFLKAAHIRPEQNISGIPDRKLSELTEWIKDCAFEVTGTNSFDKAQVCMGGVSIREVDPVTMESRLVKGLYFAGEILDVDGICGGYNLQWAWSSGRAAGKHAAKRREYI